MSDLFNEKTFFILAGIFFIIALVSIYLSWQQSRSVQKTRSNFAKNEQLIFQKKSPNFLAEWQGSPLKHFEKGTVTNLVTGTFSQDDFCFFDVEPATTVIGIKKTIPTPYKMEFYRANTPIKVTDTLRSIDTLDLNRNWLIFSSRLEPGISFQKSNLEYAFQQLPQAVDKVWLEPDWVLASLPQSNDLELILSSLRELAKIAEELQTAEIS